mmetsp:Transcript_54260/g.115794  ORF Transcript_54260/g.115794 Transcript_54260/m.115794 type:complete len:212 (-) Transcript_54260:361-996(-)
MVVTSISDPMEVAEARDSEDDPLDYPGDWFPGWRLHWQRQTQPQPQPLHTSQSDCVHAEQRGVPATESLTRSNPSGSSAAGSSSPGISRNVAYATSTSSFSSAASVSATRLTALPVFTPPSACSIAPRQEATMSRPMASKRPAFAVSSEVDLAADDVAASFPSPWPKRFCSCEPAQERLGLNPTIPTSMNSLELMSDWGSPLFAQSKLLVG